MTVNHSLGACIVFKLQNLTSTVGFLHVYFLFGSFDYCALTKLEIYLDNTMHSFMSCRDVKLYDVLR